MPARWDDHHKNDVYNKCLQEKLSNTQLLCNCDNIQSDIDIYVATINRAIHDAAQEAGCTPDKSYKPKPFWCPRLAQLRDKKRFWWRLWNDNGRPRTGCIFDCYKNVKKLFRKTFRQSVDNLTFVKYTKLHELYTSKNMRGFWNTIKLNKSAKVTSKLKPCDFKDFYSGIMQTNPDVVSVDKSISNGVESYLSAQVNDHNASAIDTEYVGKLINKLRHSASPGGDGLTAEHLISYNIIISFSCVPSSFCNGVIVLKKPILNPNQPENYRPITISTVLSNYWNLC